MPMSAKILVVDDERMNLELCSRHLQRNGYLVDLALSGRQAIEMTQQSHYDVVLLDYMMPGVSGIEVLKVLRERYGPLELAVIMVTAVSESSKVSEAFDLGANDYITKPIDFTIAIARIRSQITNIRKDKSIRVTEERYALAANGAQAGLCDWDLERDEIYYCARWKAQLGFSADELSNQPKEWFSRVHPSDIDQLQIVIQAHLRNAAEELKCDYRMQHKDGKYRWMSLHGAAVRDADGRAFRLVGTQSDVTHKATIDPLTGLPNRVFIVDRLSAALARYRADPTQHFAVLCMKLDGFKLFNDSLGNAVGDRLLVAVAQRLRSFLSDAIRQICPEAAALVVRLRGDEFAVLVESMPNPCTPETLASPILEMMGPVFLQDGHEFHCTFSIGVALPQADNYSEEDLLRGADIAMRVARARGHGEWAEFKTSMQEEQQNRLQLENDLRKAIQDSQFEVYYQPRVDLGTGAVCGFEALVRWNHPVHGLVLPIEFISVAEETGLIHAIGIWVLREACRQVYAWNRQFPRDTPYDVAVNLSPRQCQNPQLVEEVTAILQETGLRPACLHLELTESMLVEEMNETVKMLEAFKEIGIGLKIDDFGTGYSCLKYLAKLPFDTLKIDQSFVRELDTGDRDSIELVRTILNMAKGLNMEVIAEGIEKLEHVQVLTEMGCKFGQGYFYARPASSEMMESILATGNSVNIPMLP